MSNRRGFALVLTLIVTTLLIAVVVEFIREVAVETTLRRSFRDGEQALLMADSGIMGGIRLLQTVQAIQSYTSLKDAWKVRPLHLEDERGVLDVFIEEESGKLNLNFAKDYTGNRYRDVLVRLLKRLDLPADPADSLADWIDEDGDPHPGGAEATYYSTLKPPYAPRDGQLRTMEELRLIKGFGSKVYDRLRPFVTVYPDTKQSLASEININTAPPELLASLDDRMNDDLVKRIIDRRKDEPFKTPAELGTVAGLQQIATGLGTYITTKGSVYRIIATARIGETARSIEAVALMTGASATFLYWREF